MSVRKRNEYLEGDESDGEIDNGYNSDDNEESRGTIGGRASKKRRLESNSDEEFLAGEDDHAESRVDDIGDDTVHETGEDVELELELAKDDEPSINRGQTTTSINQSARKQAAAAQKAAQRTGVVYISRVPPFMKPSALRTLLSPHAPHGLGRLFLTPESPTAHTSRVKNGGNKKKSFTDGWVEFVSKKDAKVAVETLNGEIMGGKKGGWYHDDLWCLKYLKGFKWSHLTEQIASENAERAARLREEVRRSRKENRDFVHDVEVGKMVEGMERKREARGDGGGGAEKNERRRKEFKQKVAQKPRREDGLSEQAGRMQRMIF